jgi:hypothetical protein
MSNIVSSENGTDDEYDPTGTTTRNRSAMVQVLAIRLVTSIQ